MYRRIVLSALLIFFALMLYGCSQSFTGLQGGQELEEQDLDIDTITFVDSAPDSGDNEEAEALRRPPRQLSCSEESNNFRTYRGLRWRSFPVTYRFEDVPYEWQGEVNAAFATWDAEFPGAFFSFDSNSGNTITWKSIDGRGRTVAQTTIWFKSKTKEIIQFTITFDAADAWAPFAGEVCPTPEGATALDVQNVATHEIGHVVGLDHVSSNQDQMLTMYPLVRYGETSKRSLGRGDKLGFAALYGSKR